MIHGDIADKATILRVASWAIIQAPQFSLGASRKGFVPGAAQPVVGLIQTAYRAELFAVMVALEYAMARHACVRVWTDCQSMIDAFQKYVCEGTVV